MQMQAQDKEIELSCMTVSQIPPVFVDRTAIERVITNLLSNAIKYTDRSGVIKVFIGMLVDDYLYQGIRHRLRHRGRTSSAYFQSFLPC